MSESGYDVLKGFQPEGGSITYEPYTPIVPQKAPIEYEQEKAAKDQIEDPKVESKDEITPTKKN